MTIEQFAETHNVKLRRDSCGETIIPGRPPKEQKQENRSHIYDNGNGMFGVCLFIRSHKCWNNARRRLMADGLLPCQNGETEGTLTFDPANPRQSKAAMREAGIRRRVTRRPESRIKLAAILVHARTCKETPSVAS